MSHHCVIAGIHTSAHESCMHAELAVAVSIFGTLADDNSLSFSWFFMACASKHEHAACTCRQLPLLATLCDRQPVISSDRLSQPCPSNFNVGLQTHEQAKHLSHRLLHSGFGTTSSILPCIIASTHSHAAHPYTAFLSCVL